MSPSARAELTTRVRQQEVATELGQQALEEDDLDRLMGAVCEAVAETLNNEYCKVLELLPGGDEVFLRQGVGWREGLVGTATVPTDRDSQAGYTLISEEPVIVEDLRTEARFSGPELLTSHDVVSGISVVIGTPEEPWGVLGTHTTERREFSEHDATFIKNVANVLAAAITVEPLPTVEGDPSQLRQVFQNLLDNAVEYSGDSPPAIRISAERTGDRFEISVRDEGIGIDPDDADRVFEVFQRLHSHEEHPGTGIDLALCRRIVERHGGEIWVESAPGDGTTVSFTLPDGGER